MRIQSQTEDGAILQRWQLRWRAPARLAGGSLLSPHWVLEGKEPLEGGCFEAASTVTIRGQCFTTSCSVQETCFLSTEESKSFKGTEGCLKQESKCGKKERCISLDLKLIPECSHSIVFACVNLLLLGS